MVRQNADLLCFFLLMFALTALSLADTDELARRSHSDVKDNGRSPQQESRQTCHNFSSDFMNAQVAHAGVAQGTEQCSRRVQLTPHDHGLVLGENVSNDAATERILGTSINI